MADLASRPSKAMAKFAPTNTNLSDVNFLSSFNTEFPLPTNQEWKLAMVPEWLKYNIFETLRGRRLDLLQWASPSGAGTGKRGQGTVGSTTQAATEKPPPDAANMLLTFTVAVREGQYGLGRQVQVQSVSKALRAVAQTSEVPILHLEKFSLSVRIIF
jgi:hypothetical protein